MSHQNNQHRAVAYQRPETAGRGGPRIRVGGECQPVQIPEKAAPFPLLTNGMTS